MNENKKTLYFIGAAVLLLLLAFMLVPRQLTPEAFQEQGEEFFPQFTDPNDALSLEVVTYDSTTGSVVPFKVHFRGGRWSIPSHHDYPADGKDRLAKTAAGVIDIKRDDYRGDNIADHGTFGLFDPLDETAPLDGRGQRLTIRGANDQILADIIIGKQVEGRQNMRFVRKPDSKKVYASIVDIDLSINFSDWIETDLLQLMRHKIVGFSLKDYSINERTGKVDNRDVIILDKKDENWAMKGIKRGQQLDSTKIDSILSTIDSLVIVGVRPKPAGFSASLKAEVGQQSVQQEDIRSLQSKGFYITREGQLLSNEGELQVQTDEGVLYVLRFGEVLYGSGLAVSAGSDSQSSNGGQAENRYLFVTAQFTTGLFKEPTKPDNYYFEGQPDSLLSDVDRKNKELSKEYDIWRNKIDKGQKIVADHNQRFADWYYVITDNSFQKLHLTRSDLIAK